MRNCLTSSVRRLSAGWYWPLVLLALPNCGFSVTVTGIPHNLDPGPTPRTTLVLCDIERVLERHCATDADKMMGIRLAEAAIALNEGRTSAIGLDESPDARARCGGEPEAVPYIGAFPEGQSACLNGFFLGDPTHYAIPTDACVALCEDGFGSTENGTFVPEKPPDPMVVAFCTARASASTNVPGDPNPGFTGACTPAGDESPDFDSPLFPDPRRNPEPVVWGDLNLIGVSPSGSSLTRTAAATGNFDAGAASAQLIARSDAYVEFGAAESTLSHVAGLSAIVGGCPVPGGCPDTDPSLADIDFAISLNLDGRFYILEHGALVPGPDVNSSFGTYSTADRFRVTLHDHSDGTADVAYSKLLGACTVRTECAETIFRTVTGSPAHYPLRADASFREPGATLTNVTLVRIH